MNSNSKKPVFVIDGYPGAGKDTFVNLVGKFIPVKNYSTIDKVKEAALLLGWDGEKNSTSRGFLNRLKMLSVDYYDDAFLSTLDAVSEFDEDDTCMAMFIHSREEHEIRRFQKQGFKVIVVRGRGEPTQNSADSSIYSDNDIVVYNNESLEKLEETARAFAMNVANGLILRGGKYEQD